VKQAVGQIEIATARHFERITPEHRRRPHRRQVALHLIGA